MVVRIMRHGRSLSPAAGTRKHEALTTKEAIAAAGRSALEPARPNTAVARSRLGVMVGAMRVLILGGNGFIGSAVARRLLDDGHQVACLARDTEMAARRMPDAVWLRADIAKLAAPRDWTPWLADRDAVVNCAGALQDGTRDDVAAVQEIAMRALFAAAARSSIGVIVQISANTGGAAGETIFLATKRAADEALARSGVDFVILRPAMVVGRNAHGGSALLRALAAFPFATPLAFGETPIQFVALDDVTQAVSDAVGGRLTIGSDVALASAEVRTLAQAVALHRSWLGLEPRSALPIPPAAAKAVSFLADCLGHLGWRSPMRSTAMLTASGGVVVGGGEPTTRASMTLEQTLRAAPAGVQDLWFARLYLLKPLIIGTLCVFWLLSGIIALSRFDQASGYLLDSGFSPKAAEALTLLTSLVDIALGAGIALRRYAAPALQSSLAVALAYLAGATLLQPALWAEPLGPLLKVVPAIILALAALAILDER